MKCKTITLLCVGMTIALIFGAHVDVDVGVHVSVMGEQKPKMNPKCKLINGYAYKSSLKFHNHNNHNRRSRDNSDNQMDYSNIATKTHVHVTVRCVTSTH